jgi:hypothetical protein
MITYIKNKLGYIRSFCEWTVVDEAGNPDDRGAFIYVREFWVHERQRGNNKEIRKFISRILSHRLCKYVIYIYWHRRKYNSRKFMIKASRLAKMGV